MIQIMHYIKIKKYIKNSTYIYIYALIAQSVERKAFNLVVVGSSPTESIYFFIKNFILF